MLCLVVRLKPFFSSLIISLVFIQFVFAGSFVCFVLLPAFYVHLAYTSPPNPPPHCLF